MSDKLNNIVFLRTDRIGEVLLATTAADCVRRARPGARISFVTSAYSRPLIEGREDIAEVLTADTMIKGFWPLKALKLASNLRKGKYDTAVVMNPHKMLHLACFLAGIPRRVGYDRKWAFLLTDRMPDERNKAAKHEIEYTMDLVGALGIPADATPPRLFPDKGLDRFIESLLAREKLDDRTKPLIVVHPASSNPDKMWPDEKFAELLKRLDSGMSCCLAVIGSHDEKDLAGKIVEKSGARVFNSAGEFDLKKLTAFLSRASLYIGNDAGPMHMAAALGVPIIAIFSKASSPVRWRPWGDRHAVFCDRGDGKEVSPKMVYEEALKMIGKTGSVT